MKRNNRHTWSNSSSDSSLAIGAKTVHSSVSSIAWLNDENFEHLKNFFSKIHILINTLKTKLTSINFFHFHLYTQAAKSICVQFPVVVVVDSAIVAAFPLHTYQMKNHFRTVDMTWPFVYQLDVGTEIVAADVKCPK